MTQRRRPTCLQGCYGHAPNAAPCHHIGHTEPQPWSTKSPYDTVSFHAAARSHSKRKPHPHGRPAGPKQNIVSKQMDQPPHGTASILDMERQATKQRQLELAALADRISLLERQELLTARDVMAMRRRTCVVRWQQHHGVPVRTAPEVAGLRTGYFGSGSILTVAKATRSLATYRIAWVSCGKTSQESQELLGVPPPRGSIVCEAIVKVCLLHFLRSCAVPHSASCAGASGQNGTFSRCMHVLHSSRSPLSCLCSLQPCMQPF
jgi:hypothetical protein